MLKWIAVDNFIVEPFLITPRDLSVLLIFYSIILYHTKVYQKDRIVFFCYFSKFIMLRNVTSHRGMQLVILINLKIFSTIRIQSLDIFRKINDSFWYLVCFKTTRCFILRIYEWYSFVTALLVYKIAHVLWPVLA